MPRIDATFTSGGLRCAAWLHLPEGPGPHPCVVVAHGIGATREVRLGAYAEVFARAGFALFAFDYRHWGASEGVPRQHCSIPRQLADIEAAIDAAAAHPAIDRRRVALFGTSFGGGHALVVGARRPDLAAVISQCTVADCLAVALKTPPRQVLRWFGLAVRDLLHGLSGRPPVYLKLAGRTGEAALMAGPGAEAAYRAMVEGPSPWVNRIAARMVAGLPFYRPVRRAGAIAAPLLVVVCDRDEICPPAIAARAAALAPRGRAVHFDSGHFEIYFGALFEAATAAMIDFLQAETGRPAQGTEAAA